MGCKRRAVDGLKLRAKMPTVGFGDTDHPAWRPGIVALVPYQIEWQAGAILSSVSGVARCATRT
jgi:hypothetical protein